MIHSTLCPLFKKAKLLLSRNLCPISFTLCCLVSSPSVGSDWVGAAEQPQQSADPAESGYIRLSLSCCLKAE